jgi:tetrahydromethanopterin S-methyltransferase subunit B
MENAAKELESIKARIDKAVASRTRAQIEYDNAMQTMSNAMEELKKYGITSIEEAVTKLHTLEKDYEKALSEVEEALREAGE